MVGARANKINKKRSRRTLSYCFYWCLGPESNRYSHEDRGILSPLRLPVPPPRHLLFFLMNIRKLVKLILTFQKPLFKALHYLIQFLNPQPADQNKINKNRRGHGQGEGDHFIYYPLLIQE